MHQLMFIENVRINIVTISRHWLMKSLFWVNNHKLKMIEILLRTII